jgi:hypothetical protein
LFVPRLRLPAGPGLVVLDLLVLTWVVLFAILGAIVHAAVEDLLVLSTSVSTAGQAVDDTGRAIGSIDLPLVGGAIAAVGDQIRAAGRSVVEAAGSAGGSIERLALISGLVVGVVPSLPLLGYYLPPRLGRALEARAVRATILEAGGDRGLERLLARRAVAHLSFRDLRRISRRPWEDIERDEVSALAAAELARIGLSPGLLDRSAGRGSGAV